MRIDVHYGDGVIPLHLPQGNVTDIICPCYGKGVQSNSQLIAEVLNCDDAGYFQRQAVGRRVCVMLADGTRDMPLKDIFGGLFALLRGCSFIEFLICTGTHNADTAENRRIKQQIEDAGMVAGIGDFRVHVHDCQNDEFINAGRTNHGTEVIYNAKVDDADIFLVLTDVKCHYFGGYSNAVKNFVPGICTFRTAELNHSLALDERSTFGVHPWHSDSSRHDNPLACDQLEGMEMIVRRKGVYALATISTSGQIAWAGFGAADMVCAEAFDAADKMNTHTVTPVERLIVSPGGMPNDVDLYIAQRALELTRQAVKDGGEVLFLSACPKGIGEEQTMENFYNRLTMPIDEILASIENEYKLFSHKPYKFAQLIKRLRRIWVYSQIDDRLIEAAHMSVTHDPQEVVDGWLKENPDVKITIIDGANKIALYKK